MAAFTRFSWQLAFVILLWCGYALFSVSTVMAQTATLPEAWYPVTSLPVTLADRNALLHNGFIYVIGGKDSNGDPSAAVYRSAIGPGVELAPTWVKLSDLVRGRHNHATVASDTFIYTVGGISGDTKGISTSIYYNRFLSNGNLTDWSETKRNKLPYSVYAHDATAHNGYLYTVGGANDKNKALRAVYFMPIKADGSVDTGDYTSNLPNNSLHHAVVGYQSWLYVIGGLEDEGKAVYAQIYRATIKPDGTLSGWSYLTDLPDSPTNLQPKGRYYSEALIRGGQLVVLGGRDQNRSFADVLSAPILADGTLGTWQFLAPLPEPRHRFGAVLGPAGQIYVTAGLHLAGTQGTSDVYHSEVYVLTQRPASVCQLANTPFVALAAQMPISYKISCKVTPSFPLTGVSVIIPIPPMITFRSAEQGGTLSADQSNVIWQLGDKAPGEEFSLVYHGEASAAVTPASVIVSPGATIGWQFKSEPATTTTNLAINSPFQIFLATIHK